MPFTGESVTVRSKLFKAKPTPFSLISSICFHCENNVDSSFLSYPFSASLVSCMSMFSLSNSESIMAVFIASYIC